MEGCKRDRGAHDHRDRCSIRSDYDLCDKRDASVLHVTASGLRNLSKLLSFYLSRHSYSFFPSVCVLSFCTLSFNVAECTKRYVVTWSGILSHGEPAKYRHSRLPIPLFFSVAVPLINPFIRPVASIRFPFEER